MGDEGIKKEDSQKQLLVSSVLGNAARENSRHTKALL